MSHPACRSCKGSGKFYSQHNKSYDCRACNGYGVNRDLYETTCDRCRRSLIYKVGQQAPRFCKDCRNIDLEKRCEQSGCTNTIRYKVGWDNVSSYCRRCQGKRQEGASASTCPGTGVFMCGKLIWSPRGKTFTLCPDCGAKKRAEEEAKWQTKSCPGLKGQSYCGKTIKYRIDWDKQPDICQDCREKAKREKAERDAKRRTKPCKRCREEIIYYTDGKQFNYCKTCNSQRVKVNRNEKGTLQATTFNGELLFTFGRCSPPKETRIGGDAERRREWARNGYYWVSLPGDPHETFIVDRNPVVDQFINIGENKDVSYSSPSLRRIWAMLAIAIANNS